jgi:hypothetical protein
MEKPKTNNLSLNFSERRSFVAIHTIFIAEITYSQTDVDYALKASGEGPTHPEALQEALIAMNWKIALDSEFTEQEVQLLIMAYKAYLDHGGTTWYTETSLALIAGVEIQGYLESNPIRQLAKVGLMLKHVEANRTLFRLSDFGQYIVESHHQFKTAD